MNGLNNGLNNVKESDDDGLWRGDALRLACRPWSPFSLETRAFLRAAGCSVETFVSTWLQILPPKEKGKTSFRKDSLSRKEHQNARGTSSERLLIVAQGTPPTPSSRPAR